MKITVLGCGSAFSKINYNQCFMLEEDGRKMLIDFGAKAPMALDKADVNIMDIDDVYISHQHGDHIGGLEEMAFSRYDWMNFPRRYDDYLKVDNIDIMKPYAPRIIANRKLLENLWNTSLKGGLESMQGFVAKLETFFEPMPIDDNETFEWQGWTVHLVQQVHIFSGSVISQTFGLFFERDGRKSVYFTTDAQYFQPEQVEVFYNKADIIFQDCECLGVDTKNKKFIFSSGVHASYAKLAGWPSANAMVLPDDIKSKIYLSHYQDFVTEGKDFMGNDCNWSDLALEDGFKDFVHVGMEIDV